MFKVKQFLPITIFVFAFLALVGTINAAPMDVSGWGWFGSNCTESSCAFSTDPIGWISFNNANVIPCDGVDYKVTADYDTEELAGYAWIGVGEDSDYSSCNTVENSVGWLDFNSTLSTWPSGINPPYNFAAKVVAISGKRHEIQGWAPIISKDNSGDAIVVSWARFKGSNYSIVINEDGTIGTADNEKHASAGSSSDTDFTGLGWIDMSLVVFTPPPVPPEAPDVTVIDNYCFDPDSPYVLINWDNQIGVNQVDYQFQIAHNSDFTGVVYDNNGTGLNSSFTIPFAQIITYDDLNNDPNLCDLGINYCEFNHRFYIRVKVKDLNGLWSDWSSSSSVNQFVTPDSEYPNIDYNASTYSPLQGDTVILDGQLTNSPSLVQWQWTADSGIVFTSQINQEDTEARFDVIGQNQKITLEARRVGDSTWCYVDKYFNIGFPLPIFKEILPR